MNWLHTLIERTIDVPNSTRIAFKTNTIHVQVKERGQRCRPIVEVPADIYRYTFNPSNSATSERFAFQDFGIARAVGYRVLW